MSTPSPSSPHLKTDPSPVSSPKALRISPASVANNGPDSPVRLQDGRVALRNDVSTASLSMPGDDGVFESQGGLLAPHHRVSMQSQATLQARRGMHPSLSFPRGFSAQARALGQRRSNAHMAPVPQRPYGISQANGFQFGYSIPSANSGHGLRGVLPTALSIQPVRWILDPGFNSPCWSDRYDKQNLPGPCGEIIPSMNHITRTDAKLKIGPDGGPLRGPHHQPLRDIHRDMPDQVSSLKEDIWKLSMLQDLYGCSSRDLAMRMIEEISEQAFERRLARYRTKRGKMSNRPLHTNKEVPLEEMKAIDGLTDDQLRFNSCWELSIAMKHHRQPGTDNIYPVPWPAGDFDVVSERMRNAKVALAHWKKAARDGGKPESEWQKEVPKRNRGPRRKSGRSGMATASPETEAS